MGFEADWHFVDAPFVRQTISMSLATLELVYYETKTGANLFKKNRLNAMQLRILV